MIVKVNAAGEILVPAELVEAPPRKQTAKGSCHILPYRGDISTN
jgi:hypothetical protein